MKRCLKNFLWVLVLLACAAPQKAAASSTTHLWPAAFGRFKRESRPCRDGNAANLPGRSKAFVLCLKQTD